MEDNFNPIPEIPQEPPKPDYTAHGRELIFGGILLLLSIFMVNSVLFGGFHLGFAVISVCMILCSWLYLRKSGRKFGWYEKALLALSLVIAAGFGRSADGFVKFVMLMFLFVAVNLAFAIAAGQNRRDPNGALSLLDAPRAFYRLGLFSVAKSGHGIAEGFKQGGETTRKFGAVGTGLLVSAPILIVMICLLIRADAAFEGLMDLLPEVDMEEYFLSILWGILLGWILYSRGLALTRSLKPERAEGKFQGLHPLTVNTILTMVCLVYVVYLVSQLAYLSGGLSGILPEEFTMAEYARRGFFEMAWLCAINLAILCAVMWLIRAEGKLPLITRIAGSFLGAVTIFLVITASAKMFLYIGSYGLTRLRVLTEVIMLWLAITTVLITIRLFARKMPYMKAVVLCAMVLGALVFWVDVNSFVAEYNMDAYRSGKLETVDVSHMGELGAPGVKHLIELTEDEDPEVAEKARDILHRWNYEIEDYRDWNYSDAQAARQMAAYRAEQTDLVLGYLSETLGIELASGTVVYDWAHTFVPEEGRRFLRIKFAPEEAELVQQQLIDAEWTELPLVAGVRTLIGGGKSLFSDYVRCYTLPDGREGWWLFRDLHPDADTEKSLHSREGYCFQLAWYDAKAQRLYYFEADTLDLEENP